MSLMVMLGPQETPETSPGVTDKTEPVIAIITDADYTATVSPQTGLFVTDDLVLEGWKIRTAVRALVTDPNERVGLQYIEGENALKIPGGGIAIADSLQAPAGPYDVDPTSEKASVSVEEDDLGAISLQEAIGLSLGVLGRESPEVALARELREEIGLREIGKAIVTSLGVIVEFRQGEERPGEDRYSMVQLSHCFWVILGDDAVWGEPTEEGSELRWSESLAAAVADIEATTDPAGSYDLRFMRERDMHTLRRAMGVEAFDAAKSNTGEGVRGKRVVTKRVDDDSIG